MTEAEWLASGDPLAMLSFVGTPYSAGVSGTGPDGRPYTFRVTGRQLRLFAAACCRDNWGLLDAEAKSQVEYAVRSADDPTIDQVNVRACWVAHWRSTVSDDMRRHQEGPGWDCLHQQPHVAAVETMRSMRMLSISSDLAREEDYDRAAAGRDATLLRHANLLRDVLGNPYRPAAPAPFDAPHYRNARQVARSIYDASDFASCPVLADALEDAGYTDEGLLNHLRGRGLSRYSDTCRVVHARGCWAVDLVLGKG